jgi:hypothetical protein
MHLSDTPQAHLQRKDLHRFCSSLAEATATNTFDHVPQLADRQ